jgi:hypothetical protein
MRGKPLERALEAARLALKNLPADAYFNVVSLGS